MTALFLETEVPLLRSCRGTCWERTLNALFRGFSALADSQGIEQMALLLQQPGISCIVLSVVYCPGVGLLSILSDMKTAYAFKR